MYASTARAARSTRDAPQRYRHIPAKQMPLLGHCPIIKSMQPVQLKPLQIRPLGQVQSELQAPHTPPPETQVRVD